MKNATNDRSPEEALRAIEKDRKRRMTFAISGLVVFVAVLIGVTVGAYNEPSVMDMPEQEAFTPESGTDWNGRAERAR